MFEAVYSCVLPLGIPEGCNQVAVVNGFFRSAIANRQGAIADGLHGLNPRNTAHRYTPVVATSVNVATGKSQVHGGTRPVDKVNTFVKRTWGFFCLQHIFLCLQHLKAWSGRDRTLLSTLGRTMSKGN